MTAERNLRKSISLVVSGTDTGTIVGNILGAWLGSLACGMGSQDRTKPEHNFTWLATWPQGYWEDDDWL